MVNKMPIDTIVFSADEMMSGGVWRWIPYINQTQLLNAIKKNDKEDNPVSPESVSNLNNCGKSATAEIPLFTTAK